MKENNRYREKMLANPTYWVEGINGLLYDAIVNYMEKNQMKRKDLARHLNISTGRISQILNDGDINFSLEKIIEIAIKVDKFPNFSFEDKEAYFEKERFLAHATSIFMSYNRNEVSLNFDEITVNSVEEVEPRVIALHHKVEMRETSFVVSNQLTY